MIYVTSLANLDDAIARLKPGRLMSLMPSDDVAAQVTRPDHLDPDHHLVVGIHDITEVIPGLVAPEVAHVAAIIAFAEDWAQAHRSGESGPMVVHCLMGISRSGAAAYIALCALSEPGQEAAIARALRDAGPHIQPNLLMVQIADELLERDGRMAAAIEDLGWGSGYNAVDWVALDLWPRR